MVHIKEKKLSHKKCSGCRVLQKPMTIMGYLECNLNPVFNDQQCPCITCLVKAVCTESDYDCEKYHEFAKLQFTKNTAGEEDIPCKQCEKFNDCVEKIEALKIEQYGINPEYISEDEDYQFHTDIMSLLSRDCVIMQQYFPFVVVSRDGLMAQPTDGTKHEKASNIENIEENEYDRRYGELYWFFHEYNVTPTGE